MSESQESLLQDVFVGRQPIYGRRLELFAYELLYRDGDVDRARFLRGDGATSRVLLNTFSEFGLESVVGEHLAFVNLTRGFIIGEYPLALPRKRVVLEVLEDVPADPEVLEGLRRLRQQGFQIALDDFVLTQETEPLLELTDIVKVDVLGLGEQEIREYAATLRPLVPKLLAEKIESREVFDVCLDCGFDYFQGYFLARPNVLRGACLSPSRLELVNLLAELQDPNCDIDRIQAIVSRDVTLSFKLLKHMNAAIYGMPRKIESIRETVIYLGLKTVQNLASLFLLASIDDKPHDLLVTSMLRAKMCERMAQLRGVESHGYFTAGLFSTLDALLDAPMTSIVLKLPLGQDLSDALMSGKGAIGEALACAVAYERGDWENVSCLGLTRAQIKTAFLDAVQWVEGIDADVRHAA